MLKNHYVNRAPYRTASIDECPTTGQITVELTADGELLEVQLVGEGSRALTLARQTALSWTRYGVSDPSHATPELATT
jgi:hypothetical protein